MSSAFAALPHGRVLQYHNVTPAQFFAPLRRRRCSGLPSIAREELAGLAPACRAGARRLGVQPPGARRPRVSPTRACFPIAVNTERLTNAPPHPVLEEILDDGLVNFLFVGRSPRTRKLRTISGWPSSTSAMSTPTTASSLLAATTWCRRLCDHPRAAGRYNAGGSLHLYRPGA